MADGSIYAYVKLNARIEPGTRGDVFEEPLAEAMEGNGLGEVTGGGTMQSPGGEIDFCGIDVELFDLERGVPFVRDFLRDAPQGSSLEYEVRGQPVSVTVGQAEGLAIYINGTDLPDEVYQQCDVNVVGNTISKALLGHGAILGHWVGPRETALYLYGPSADEMWRLIASFMAEYPLCRGARVVRIA